MGLFTRDRTKQLRKLKTRALLEELNAKERTEIRKAKERIRVAKRTSRTFTVNNIGRTASTVGRTAYNAVTTVSKGIDQLQGGRKRTPIRRSSRTPTRRTPQGTTVIIQQSPQARTPKGSREKPRKKRNILSEENDIFGAFS